MDQGDPAGTVLPIEDYAYDGEGNRLASHLSSLYSSNDHNQLLEDDSYTYAYDEPRESSYALMVGIALIEVNGRKRLGTFRNVGQY